MTQIQPNVPARTAVRYTGGGEGITSDVVLNGINAAMKLLVGNDMLFDTPQGVIDAYEEVGEVVGGDNKVYKVTVQEVGTTE